MQKETEQPNAGLRLWAAQKQQGTGLCVGLDPHYDLQGELSYQLYERFAKSPEMDLYDRFYNLVNATDLMFQHSMHSTRKQTAKFISGVTNYYYLVIDCAWKNGIRVFKPQSAFFERFFSYGSVVLALLCERIRTLSLRDGQPAFVILDAKRGDIDSTQAPYYVAYLSQLIQEVIPGMRGAFSFDSMTVTIWMGVDVLTPGLPFFKDGRGAIVVTRSSNPSGTTLQDLEIKGSDTAIELSENQKPYHVEWETVQQIEELMHTNNVCAHHVMLYETEKFSAKHGLNQNGVSPIFSVVGSTVKVDSSYRSIRPNGIALIPAFGAQGGKFSNVMSMVIREGLLKGHLGVLSSSRDHNFSWLQKYGGKGDPTQLEGEMTRAIDEFRVVEKRSYNEAGLDYPF